MRKYIKAATLALVLPYSAMAVDFPQWEVKQNFACYDFENAKQLKLYSLECERTKAALTKLKLDFKTSQAGCEGSGKTIAELKKSNLELSTQLKATIADRDKLDVKVETEQARADAASKLSILGGGIPWVVGIGAACLIAGIVIGAKK